MTKKTLTDDQVQIERQKLIVLYTDRITKLQDELHSVAHANTTTWIVRNPEGNVTLRYVLAGDIPMDPVAARADNATQFETQRQAAAVARDTRNGAGRAAEAVPYTLALHDEIVLSIEQRTMIQEIVKEQAFMS